MNPDEFRSLIRESIDEVLTEGPRDPVIFHAIFFIGGPGSGKSYILKKLGIQSMGFKLVNPDTEYEYLIKKSGHDLSTFDVGSAYGQNLRVKSSELSDKKRGNAESGYISQRLGLIFDGTGKDAAKIEKLKNTVESLGYETMMVFVNTTQDVALHRNANRARKIPDEMVKEYWEKVQRAVGQYQMMFGEGRFYTIDNSESNQKSEEMINWVSKKIRAFALTPPRNPIAKQWIKNNP